MIWLIFLITAQDTTSARKDTSYINIKGQNTLSYQAKYIVSGENPPNFYPYRMRDNLLVLNITGKIRGKIEVSGEVLQGKMEEQNKLLLGLKGDHFHLSFGDMDASLGNLIMVDKSIRGIKGGVEFNKLNAEAFYSTPRGISFIERISGDGTQGPFQLTHYPVILNSERIRVGEGLNLAPLEKGKDYRIDYTSGRITFINRVISQDEIMEVRYEYTTEEGLKPVEGGNAVIIPLNWLKFGGSHIRGGASSLHLKIGNKTIYTGIEAAEDKEKNRAYSTNGCISLKWLNLTGTLRQTGDTFNIIGKGIEKGGQWNIKGTFTPTNTFTIQSGYAGRQLDREITAGIRWRTINYSYLKYTGKNSLRVHKIRMQKKIPGGIQFGINAGKECKNIGISYFTGGNLSLRRFKFLSLNTEGTYKKGDYREWQNTSTISLSFIRYSLSTSFTIRGSSIYHPSRIIRAHIRAKPFRFLSSDGRYAIETLRRQIGATGDTTSEDALRHTGAFKITLLPFKWLNFAYRPNFSYTEAINTHIRSYSSFSNLFESALRPHRSILLGYSKEIRGMYALNSENQKTADSKDNIQALRIRFSPLSFISFSGDKTDKYGKGLYRITYPTETDTAGDTISLYKDEEDKRMNIAANLMFKDRSSVRISYIRRKYYQEIPDSTTTNIRTHTIKGRAGKYFTTIFNIYNELGYERKYGQDPYVSLQDTNIFVQTFSDEVGFTIIPIEGIRGTFSYIYSQAYNDADTRKETAQATINSSKSIFDINLRARYEKSQDPDYRTLELTLRVNVKF